MIVITKSAVYCSKFHCNLKRSQKSNFIFWSNNPIRLKHLKFINNKLIFSPKQNILCDLVASNCISNLQKSISENWSQEGRFDVYLNFYNEFILSISQNIAKFVWITV